MWLFNLLIRKHNQKEHASDSTRLRYADHAADSNEDIPHTEACCHCDVRLADIACGKPFAIKFNSLEIVKQPYKGRAIKYGVFAEDTTVERAEDGGSVSISLSETDLVPVRDLLKPHAEFPYPFVYRTDNVGNEVITAHLEDHATVYRNGSKRTPAFQITCERGKCMAILTRHLPEDPDCYYLLLFR